MHLDILVFIIIKCRGQEHFLIHARSEYHLWNVGVTSPARHKAAQAQTLAWCLIVVSVVSYVVCVPQIMGKELNKV